MGRQAQGLLDLQRNLGTHQPAAEPVAGPLAQGGGLRLLRPGQLPTGVQQHRAARLWAGHARAVDKLLPENIISIHRTQNQTELAEIYSAADLFVMPTREDNFPTVNIESLACGTPIVTFRTGGSPECIDETCGSVVEKNDIDGLEKEIRRIYEEKPFKSAACVERAKQFDMNDKFKEYVDLYGRK